MAVVFLNYKINIIASSTNSEQFTSRNIEGGFILGYKLFIIYFLAYKIDSVTPWLFGPIKI